MTPSFPPTTPALQAPVTTVDSRPKGPSRDGDRVAECYSGESAGWREVLGPGMHYHFGTIDPARPIDDAAARFSFAVRQLYPWIPTGSRVIDVGCGWGGPARMLIDERHCDVRGVTISGVQAAECTRVVPEARVSVADAQKLELDGDGERFDLAIMLESLTHMPRPDLVLRNLRPAVGRVLIRDHVAVGESGFLRDDWNMRFPLRAEMRGQSRTLVSRSSTRRRSRWRGALRRSTGWTTSGGRFPCTRPKVSSAYCRGCAGRSFFAAASPE